MQADIKTKFCESHPTKEIKGFCDGCKVFFCRRCTEEHLDHNTKSLKKFCEERKKDVLDQISISELSVQLKEKRNEMIRTGKKLQEDQKYTQGEVKIKENMAKNKDENYRQEIKRMEAATRYLIGLEDEASSIALKNACTESLKNFDIEDKIRAEFETLEKALEEARAKVKELEKELEEVNEKIETLDYLKGDGKYEFDDDKWTAFLMLNEMNPLFTPPGYRINITVDRFKAFPSVKKVFDTEDVMKNDLIDVGQCVKMTEPVEVENGLITGDYIYASLSHQGVLAIYAYSNYKYIIQFTNLNTNKQVEMNVESGSIAGFYDSMILLLTWTKPLREATVEEVFNNPKTETFREIGRTNNVSTNTDVSLLHARRVLYYPTNDDKLFSFNVDTRENTEINVGKRIWSIASLTGIDCNVKAVFKDWDDYCTYTLNNDNSVTKVSKKQSGYLSVIFPSASNPKNINDVVFKYSDDLIKGGNKINTNDLIRFEYNYSVVRVFKDVFLTYDKKTKSWVLLRIVTP